METETKEELIKQGLWNISFVILSIKVFLAQGKRTMYLFLIPHNECFIVTVTHATLQTKHLLDNHILFISLQNNFFLIINNFFIINVLSFLEPLSVPHPKAEMVRFVSFTEEQTMKTILLHFSALD